MKTITQLYEAALTTDAYGNKIVLPKTGDTYLYDGYPFTVTKVVPVNDINVVASVDLKGASGAKTTGYYDLLKTKKG